MKFRFFKTIALILCVLTLFLCVYPPAYSWGWGDFWKCLSAGAALTAATFALIAICGAAVASILIDGGVTAVILSAACLASFAVWSEAKKRVRKYC